MNRKNLLCLALGLVVASACTFVAQGHYYVAGTYSIDPGFAKVNEGFNYLVDVREFGGGDRRIECRSGNTLLGVVDYPEQFFKVDHMAPSYDNPDAAWVVYEHPVHNFVVRIDARDCTNVNTGYFGTPSNKTYRIADITVAANEALYLLVAVEDLSGNESWSIFASSTGGASWVEFPLAATTSQIGGNCSGSVPTDASLAYDRGLNEVVAVGCSTTTQYRYNPLSLAPVGTRPLNGMGAGAKISDMDVFFGASLVSYRTSSYETVAMFTPQTNTIAEDAGRVNHRNAQLVQPLPSTFTSDPWGVPFWFTGWRHGFAEQVHSYHGVN